MYKIKIGAANRTWTGTNISSKDFKSFVSAYSTTAAKITFYKHHKRNFQRYK